MAKSIAGSSNFVLPGFTQNTEIQIPTTEQTQNKYAAQRDIHEETNAADWLKNSRKTR